MEEYFVHKCVTSDAAPLEPAPTAVHVTRASSSWATSCRCECVIVQESAHANGASRAVLSSILEMTLQSKKTSRVVLFALEPSLVGGALPKSDKLVVADYSADWSWLDAALTGDRVASPLLAKMDERLAQILAEPIATVTATPVQSSRPVVLVIDSMNVLLETYPLQRVLLWLKQLRRDVRIGSVIVRVNASAAASTVAQTLAYEATAVVQVETASSLRAYPILAKERRREIPKRMHGMTQLLRKKKNGRTSESVEYFQSQGKRLQYFAREDAADAPKSTIDSRAPASILSSASALRATPGSKALPVSADEVSFNLSISADEEVAKRNVQLPYMHQGGSAADGSGTPSAAPSSVNNLIFIDEDDPDWDDDDLDDDLDV